nr:hypothetical protein [Neolewinella persica]
MARQKIGKLRRFSPGVTIGGRTVIGSGSDVTRDIPSNVFAVANGCRINREITDADRVI